MAYDGESEFAADGRTDGEINSDSDVQQYDGRENRYAYAQRRAERYRAELIVGNPDSGSVLENAREWANGDRAHELALINAYARAYAEGLAERLAAYVYCPVCERIGEGNTCCPESR